MESKFHKGKFSQFIEKMGEKKAQKIRQDLRMGYRRKEYSTGLPHTEKKIEKISGIQMQTEFLN